MLTLIRPCFVALCIFGVAARLPGDEDWRAGTARTNITPLEPVCMAGYASRTRPAKGKLTDLWAKALVIEDAQGNRGLLLTLDLVGIDRTLSLSICDRISKQFGFERDEIAICSSHTHSGPVVGHNLAPMHYQLVTEGQRQLIDAYAEKLQNDLLDIVSRAVGDLEPCRLRLGTGVATFAVNRRNNRPEQDVLARRADGTLAGPTDHDVPVLSVRDEEGELKALVFGYACHATVLNIEQWSGDYPGYAQIELERLYPGCQAMFWAGCGGDQNPLPRRTVALAQHYGRQLAGAVETALLTSRMIEVPATLQTGYAEIDLPLDELPDLQTLERSASSTNQYEQARARMWLARLDSGQDLPQTYPYPISVWNLGNKVHWIQLGGEVVVDYALRLKAETNQTVWVAAYANDVMAYIPSRRVLREGGYEGASSMIYYGLPTTWAPTIENAIVVEALRQIAASVTETP